MAALSQTLSARLMEKATPSSSSNLQDQRRRAAGLLIDVLTRLVNGHLQSRLNELLTWNYARNPVAAAL